MGRSARHTRTASASGFDLLRAGIPDPFPAPVGPHFGYSTQSSRNRAKVNLCEWGTASGRPISDRSHRVIALARREEVSPDDGHTDAVDVFSPDLVAKIGRALSGPATVPPFFKEPLTSRCAERVVPVPLPFWCRRDPPDQF